MREEKKHRITRGPEKFSNNGNLAHDEHIAALIVEHGVGELWTADRDFARFPGILLRSGHEYKYSLAYVENGECVLRYDNEAGKGDHIHCADEDRPYNFTTPEQLLADFWSDVDTWRSK